MAYIDTKYIGECETCQHHRSGKCDTWCDCGESYQPDMTKIPTADVVEVVRCKDCVHFEAITLDSGISVGLGNCKNTNGINLYPNETDFCSYGERNLSEIPTGCERSDT